MDEVARLLTLLALAGGALTLLGGVCIWFLDETRRIRRTLAKVLSAAPQPMLSTRGRGAGIGFNLKGGRVAVTWDKGTWALVYLVDELVGVELIVDRQVAARAFRGEPRRPLDHLGEPQERVRLRFVFDDPDHPDFELDLWRPEDEARARRLEAVEALREANRWMARMEALLRRAGAGGGPLATQPPRVRRPAPAPLFDDETFADDAFEDDPEDVVD